MSDAQPNVPDWYGDKDAPYTGPVIELYIGMSYDALTHRIYTRVPTGWASMSEKEREDFIQNEADTWAAEQLEIGGIIHKDVKTATEKTRGYWSSGFSEDQLEDMFG